MYDAKLFVGLPINHDIEGGLKRAGEYAVSMFINNESDYLHESFRDGVRYIGKFVYDVQVEETLPMLGENIYSLLQRLIPDFEPTAYPLVIFPCTTEPADLCETAQKPTPQTDSQ